MRIYKTRLFAKWARKEGLFDGFLSHAIQEMENGLIDGDLGSGVYKKRIALPGRGKRGGARTIIAYRTNNVAFFIFGYSKSKKENITAVETIIAKKFAVDTLQKSDFEINNLLKSGRIIEVKYVR